VVSIVVVSYGLCTVVAVIDADVEDKEPGDDNGNIVLLIRINEL